METLNFAFVLQNSLLIDIKNPNLFVVLRSTLQYSPTLPRKNRDLRQYSVWFTRHSQIIKQLNEEQKITILLVEQNANLALSIAEHGYVMENGKIVLDDSVDKLKENEDVKMFYLGLTEMGTKRSYRDAKFYKRRKRWLT